MFVLLPLSITSLAFIAVIVSPIPTTPSTVFVAWLSDKPAVLIPVILFVETPILPTAAFCSVKVVTWSVLIPVSTWSAFASIIETVIPFA